MLKILFLFSFFWILQLQQTHSSEFPEMVEIGTALHEATKLKLVTINEELNDRSKFVPYVVDYERTEWEPGIIEWGTHRILIIHTKERVNFPIGFKIIYKGQKGGLIVRSHFDSQESDPFVFSEGFSIDFSESTNGAISIFYNPYKGETSHKYNNPFDFTPYIIKAEDTYLGAFMWINVGDKYVSGEHCSVLQDFKDINRNLSGAYALTKTLRLWLSSYNSRNSDCKINNFTGWFNKNNFDLEITGWTSGWGCSLEEYIFGKDHDKNKIIPKSIPYEEPVLLTPLWQGVPEREKAKDKEYSRLKKAHEKFFIREPSTKRTKVLLKQFKIDYDATKASTLNIEGLPSRTRILLLRKITDLKLRKLAENGQTSAWWRTITKSNANIWDDYDDNARTYKQTTDLLPTTYVFGKLTHTLTNQYYDNKEKPGYAYYDQLGTYDQINALYLEICEKINPKKIAELSRMSRISGNAITPEHLLNAGYNDTFESAIIDAKYLNKLNFLLDHEVASRLVRIEETTQYDALPIGVMIARMQHLVLDMTSSWGDLSKVLPKKSNYHCFTNGAYSRENAIKTISDDFNFLSQNNRQKYLSGSPIVIWANEHPYVEYDDNPRSLVITTQEGIHQELLNEYGGGYESSGDPYESDIES